MTRYNTTALIFGRINKLSLEADFNGGDITSDTGLALLKAFDQKIGFTGKPSNAIDDPCFQPFVAHSQY